MDSSEVVDQINRLTYYYYQCYDRGCVEYEVSTAAVWFWVVFFIIYCLFCIIFACRAVKDSKKIRFQEAEAFRAAKLYANNGRAPEAPMPLQPLV